MRYVSLTVFSCLLFTVFANGEAISLWNFNDGVLGADGGVLELPADYGNGTMTSNFASADIRDSTGSTLNSQPGDPAGQALLLKGKNNNGGNLTWMVNTTGFSSINISFAARGTGTGFNANQFQYSKDSGLFWTDFGLPFQPESDFGLLSFDLGRIDALDNNTGAGFRIVFDGATSYTGNNRIDNLIVSGVPDDFPPTTPVPEPSIVILLGFGLCGAFFIQGMNSRTFSVHDGS